MENIPPSNDQSFCQKKQNEAVLEEYKRSRVLPHINEQYEYRITHRLLIEKIINPRRDKTIIDSLANTSCKYFSKKRKGTNNCQPSNIRRKILANVFTKKDPSTLSQQIYIEPVVQGTINKVKTRICPEKVQEIKDRKGKEVSCRDKKEDLTVSGWIETQTSSLRDNFVGRIIRNNTSRSKEISKRRPNLSNFCQQFSLSNEFFFEGPTNSQQKPSKLVKSPCLIKRNIPLFKLDHPNFASQIGKQ